MIYSLIRRKEFKVTSPSKPPKMIKQIGEKKFIHYLQC